MIYGSTIFSLGGAKKKKAPPFFDKKKKGAFSPKKSDFRHFRLKIAFFDFFTSKSGFQAKLPYTHFYR